MKVWCFLTCSSCCCICCSFRARSDNPDRLHRRRRSACLRPSTPQKHTHTHTHTHILPF